MKKTWHGLRSDGGLSGSFLERNDNMARYRAISCVLVGCIGLAPMTGCENLPGNQKEQGAVVGGVGGAAAGAAIAKNNRILGALIGGALGAGGGYLVGANWDKITGKKKADAVKASQDAQTNPAKASDVENAKTADLNGDGFVTLDEVVAQQDAGLSSKEQIRRLQKTQQYFELTSDQEQYLRDHGVKNDVIVAMRSMNQDVRTASDKSSGNTSGNQRIGHDSASGSSE
jgi:glycine zipper 2TM protein